jgi:hypothetical protein
VVINFFIVVYFFCDFFNNYFIAVTLIFKYSAFDKALLPPAQGLNTPCPQWPNYTGKYNLTMEQPGRQQLN